MAELSEWETFYVIVGSSAGALIGLQFVVLTLIAERPSTRVAEASAAFATPSVVHFGVVLLLAALVSAPWQTIGPVAALWGMLGVVGIIYSVLVARRMKSQKAYTPVLEDWLFFLLLPLAAYVMLAVAALITQRRTRPAMFILGAATLLLLFVGIHNAWDAVTYHVFTKGRAKAHEEPESKPREN
jgi:hypothetical protein